MSKLIALDDGHGMQTAGKRTPPIPELGGRVIHENEFNREVVKYLDIELKRCGFKTLLVAPTDADTPLSTRTNLANSKNADAYISIHYNAFDGKFDAYDPEGLSVHIYPGSKEGRKLAECVIKYLKQGTPQKNRGIVENNFHVLRETKMPAILSENGFMDNKREALLMVNVDFQKEVAREHAQGICEYFGVKYVPEKTEPSKPSTGVLYRVQTGAFKNKANADKLLGDVKSEGFDTYMVQSKDGLYKVQVGAYSVKSNADAMAKKLKAKGFNVYITTESGSPVTSSPAPSKTLKVGSKVKVKPGAKTYTGGNLSSFVYNTVYDVIQISGNRVVIGKGKAVTAAIHKDNLLVQ